jgi:hypothetical protein
MIAWFLAAAVGVLTAHTIANARFLPRPPAAPSPVDFGVSVLLPLRDEAHRVRPCLESLLGLQGVPLLEIVVLDDGSTDGTAELVRSVAAGDPRVRLVAGEPLPKGWLGKPYACHQLAAHASPSSRVLAFVDADVVLCPSAVASAVALLDGDGDGDIDLVSPYPRIVAMGLGERLMQPLLQWSWLTFLPLRALARSRRPALAAAGGQFLVVTRAGYDRAGGHAAVRGAVLEDVELARAVKRAGGRIAMADGSQIASCRMYTSWAELVAGYSKSLWSAFGSPPAATAVMIALLVLYAVPPLLAVAAVALGSWAWAGAGALGYLLGVAGRVAAGRATGAQVWPDAWAQPVSIALLAWLTARSHRLRARNALVWKGRRLDTLATPLDTEDAA